MSMIGPEYVVRMARYNAWQNRSLVSAAASLPADERTRDRGAFFGSILRTFSHLYRADAIWLHRFHGTPKPGGTVAQSPERITDWQSFETERSALDVAILEWSGIVEQPWLDAASGKSSTNGRLVVHFFNHQTHHRGQIHAMLTAAGARPGDTDLFKMPSSD